ncbi:IS110 family transposase [Amaricoccus sp. W119]|uniref:IS110 family transposase n=1 Tax=Amaricoccus sp. W119 TaxID=3391833 RepID=UPI0039A4F764
MNEATIIGIDLAKRVFQLHGAGADGRVLYRKTLSRSQVLRFLAGQPRCVVAMEACATAHSWGRLIAELGYEVRLIPPIYVKPFVKRQKNDAADAEAIVEAASRPTMRFVAVKTEEQQARAMIFRTRDLLVRQRTQLINALRGHLAEHDIVVAHGATNAKRLAAAMEQRVGSLQPLVRDLGHLYLDQISMLEDRIEALGKVLRREARLGAYTARLQTMPGIGPITAMAIEAFAPPMETFRRGRDFAAWLGLVPIQNSSGGKQRLGRSSKMGQRDIRRLLIVGAMSVVRWASRKGAEAGSWLERMLARKPRILVAIALANRMARAAWAMLTRQEEYKHPVAAMA